MLSTLNVQKIDEIVQLASEPGVKVCWLYRADSLNPARVDVVNGSRQSFEVSEKDFAAVVGQLKADGWDIRPCASTLGYTARRQTHVCPRCKGRGTSYEATEWGTIGLQKCPDCAPIPFMGEPGEGEAADDDNGNGLALHVDF